MDWNKYYEDTMKFIEKSYSVYESFKKINPDYYTGKVLHWVMEKEAVIGYGVPDYMEDDDEEYEYCDDVVFSFPVKFLSYSDAELKKFVEDTQKEKEKVDWLKKLSEDELLEFLIKKQISIKV